MVRLYSEQHYPPLFTVTEERHSRSVTEMAFDHTGAHKVSGRKIKVSFLLLIFEIIFSEEFWSMTMK